MHTSNPLSDGTAGILDITVPMREHMPVFDGDPVFRMTPVTRVIEGDPDTWNVSNLSFGTHTGTHVDPPRHFDPRGADVEAVSLEVLCGPARVLDLRGKGLCIDAGMLANAGLCKEQRLLLRTDGEGWSEGLFSADYGHITVDAARWLRAHGVKLLGVGSPSVEAFVSPGMPVHRELLAVQPSVVVVEGLDLRGVDAGVYEFLCLPLRIVNGDGGPARAILRALP